MLLPTYAQHEYRTHLYRPADRTTAPIPGVQVLLHRTLDTATPPSPKTRSRLRHSRTSRRVAPSSPRHISKPDKPHPRAHTHPLARTRRTRLVPVLARPPRQRRLVPFLFRHSTDPYLPSPSFPHRASRNAQAKTLLRAKTLVPGLLHPQSGNSSPRALAN